MASTSHRNCQYRGDGCTGKAHAGHDQCAWCYFQYVKPALQAERAEMKRRRAIKRHQLSQANRSLISEVDLKEPQMREAEETPPPFSGPAAFTVRDAVLDTVILQEIDRGIAAGKDPYEAGGDLLLKTELRHIPANIYPVPRTPEKETTPTDMPTTTTPESATAAQRGRHRADGKPPLTDVQREEIADAFRVGMSTSEICHTYQIGAATLYTIVRKAGLPLRGRNGSRQEAQMPTNTPPVSATNVAVSPPNGVVSGLTEWIVTYQVMRTDNVTVHAANYEMAVRAAIGAAEACSIDTVVSVARVRS